MESPNAPSTAGAKVLLVDDDQKLTFVLTAHLHHASYEVREAHDGAAGLAAAREWQPDVILMDLTMPVLGGLAATRQLKSDPCTSGIPIIMLTANHDTSDVVQAFEAGATEYVTKPFDFVQLLARVRTVLQLGRAYRRLDDLNAQLAGEVDAKTRRLQMLYQFMRALSRSETIDDVLDRIVQAAREATGGGRISIMLKDEDGGHLSCVRAYGIDPAIAKQIRVRPAEGIAGKVYTNGKMVVANAYPLPGHDDPGRARGGRPARVPDDQAYSRDAFLSAPLVSTSTSSEEATLGVLNVTNKDRDVPFTQDEIECVRSIADAGAIALHDQIHLKRLKDSIRVLLLTVGRLAEYRDEETGSHLERVREYARILAETMAELPPYRGVITPGFIDDLYQAAPMHDIGKVGIPDDILNKAGPLTTEEFNIMKNHTEIGRRTLQLALAETGPVPLLKMCIEIAYGHHERFDGRGYPRGVAGQNIPLAARIITLVDAYDAMTSRRCYKEPISHAEAVERIRTARGAHFDPDAVDAFLSREHDFDQTRRRLSDTEPPHEAFAVATLQPLA